MRDYKLYLKDILDAMERIEEFVEDMSFEKFKEDDKTSSAVVKKFEIIGEASKNVPEGIKIYTDPLEGNGRDARQADSYLLWSKL